MFENEKKNNQNKKHEMAPQLVKRNRSLWKPWGMKVIWKYFGVVWANKFSLAAKLKIGRQDFCE